MICINCNHSHVEKFCPNCGENAAVEKITFRLIVENSLSSITNMDKGFLFNLKNLSINTRKTIREYILGRRRGIYNPISYLLLSITIYLVIDSFLSLNRAAFPKAHDDARGYLIGYEAGRFIYYYFKYFWITGVLWLSLSSKLVFSRFNFAENIAINSFIIGHATLVSLLGLIIFDWTMLLNPIAYATIWFMLYHVFTDEKEGRFIRILQSFFCVFLFYIQLALILTGIGIMNT